MKKLIKMVTIVAGVGAMLNFAGCGNTSNDPGEIATDFFNAALDGKDMQNYIKKYCTDNAVKKFTEDGKSFIEGMASLKKSMSEGSPVVANIKCKYVIKDVKIDGEKAMVYMKMQISGKNKLTGEKYEDYVDDDDFGVGLTKINGIWKIGE